MFPFFTGPLPENNVVYEEIHQYEALKQKFKNKKQYENTEVADKIYVSLKPLVMETIRDHMQTAVSILCIHCD